MQKHIPVLIDEIIKVFNPSDDCIYIDGTFGAGGYTAKFLDANPSCKIIAFDRDEMVLPIAEKFKEKYGDRFHFVNEACNFKLKTLSCFLGH